MRNSKTNDFEKTVFIGEVLFFLLSKGETQKHLYLKSVTDLEKKYLIALRYNRMLGTPIRIENINQSINHLNLLYVWHFQKEQNLRRENL